MTALPLCDSHLAESTISHFAKQMLPEAEAGKLSNRTTERARPGPDLAASLCFCEILACGYESPAAAGYRQLAVSFLIEALNDVSHQEWAIRLLGEFGCDAQSAAPALLAIFKRSDEDSLVRTYILRALAAIVPPREALCYLLDILSVQSHSLALWPITDWIAEIGPAAGQTVPRLIEIMKESSEPRWAACSTLGKIGLPAMDGLRPLLQHEDPALRAAAVRAIGSMDQLARPIVHELFPALTDHDVAVRVAAAEAIGRIRAASGAVARRLLPGLNDPCPSVVHQVQQALWWELMEMSRRGGCVNNQASDKSGRVGRHAPARESHVSEMDRRLTKPRNRSIIAPICSLLSRLRGRGAARTSQTLQKEVVWERSSMACGVSLRP